MDIPLTEVSRMIDHLGGAAKVADDLGFDKDGGPQRVNHWRTRGIPSKILLHNMRYFELAQKAVA